MLLNNFEHEVMNDPEARKAYILEEKLDKISSLLKRIRIDKEITQSQIAKETGLSQQMVSKMEHYNSNPTLASFVKYCNCIGVDLEKAILSYYETTSNK